MTGKRRILLSYCILTILLVIALVCIILAFTTNGHAGRAAD